MTEIHLDDETYQGNLTGPKRSMLQKWFFKPGTCWQDVTRRRGRKVMIQNVDVEDRELFIRGVTGIDKGHGERIDFTSFLEKFERVKPIWGKRRWWKRIWCMMYGLSGGHLVVPVGKSECGSTLYRCIRCGAKTGFGWYDDELTARIPRPALGPPRPLPPPEKK